MTKLKHLKTYENTHVGNFVTVDPTNYDYDSKFEDFLYNTQGEIVNIEQSFSGVWYHIKFDTSKLDPNLMDKVRSKYDEDTEYKYVKYGEDVFSFLKKDVNLK